MLIAVILEEFIRWNKEWESIPVKASHCTRLGSSSSFDGSSRRSSLCFPCSFLKSRCPFAELRRCGLKKLWTGRGKGFQGRILPQKESGRAVVTQRWGQKTFTTPSPESSGAAEREETSGLCWSLLLGLSASSMVLPAPAVVPPGLLLPTTVLGRCLACQNLPVKEVGGNRDDVLTFAIVCCSHRRQELAAYSIKRGKFCQV